MTRRVVFLLALALCSMITSAHAQEQVLTIYFMGTGMNNAMWSGSGNDNFDRPETVATLWYFDTAFYLSGADNPGDGTTHFKGYVDGFPSGPWQPNWEQHNEEALRYLDRVPGCVGSCITLNLVGFSRGAVSALRFAKYVKVTPSCSKCQSIEKINVLAFDPVPGDESGGDCIHATNFNLEPGIEYLGFYAVDERSWDFSPVFPFAMPPNDPLDPRVNLFKVRGAHETLVGNTQRDGHHDLIWGWDDAGLAPVSRTLRMVATEMLGSSDWGHVRFRSPTVDERPLGVVDLNWYGGETNVDQLWQTFVTDLQLIDAYGGYGPYHNYELMRDSSYNPDGGVEAWWAPPFLDWGCHTALLDEQIDHPRCAYYHPDGYADSCLGQPNSGIDDNPEALPSNTQSGGRYKIWDLILADGSLDVDNDGIDYHEDNCPTVANADQSNLDRDSRGDACDNCPLTRSENQADGDGDGVGDVCDNCPIVPNADQTDTDHDGTGDACECVDVDCNDGDQCTLDSCVAATGGCVHVVVSDGTPCSDGSVCTSNDACWSGSCVGGGAAGTFREAAGSPFAVGLAPSSVAMGDFNPDGNRDLVTANSGDNTVTILLGDGSGGFTSAGSPVTVGSSPSSVAVGDFNGDGTSDVVTANSGDSTVTILRGDGSGGFTQFPGSPVAVGSSPSSVAVGDFDLDGTSDLVTANSGSNNVTILRGDGLGGFTQFPGSPVAVEPGPRSVAVGDFNRDGKPDLVTANLLSDNVTILRGDGSGGFTQFAGPTFVGLSPSSVAVGDFNRDGKLDLVTANSGDNTVTILWGNGSGAFNRFDRSSDAVGLSPSSVAVGDFNLDGNLDLVTANASGTVTILLGNGGRWFTESPGSPVAVEAGPFSVVVGDVNDDHRPDLVTANGSNNVTILLGNRSVVDCDDRNDCTTDACYADTGCVNVPSLPDGAPCNDRNACTTNDVCWGARCVGGATGEFTQAEGSPITVGSGSSPSSVAVGDLDLDGTSDLVTANYGDLTVTILRGNGAGTFTEFPGSPFALSSSPSSVAVGYLHNVGPPPYVVTANRDDGTVTILLEDGSGGFTQAGSPITVGLSPSSVAVGDFNLDGKSDLVTANLGSNNVRILRGDGVGGFTPWGLPVPVGSGSSPSSVAVGGFNFDPCPDLVTANSGSNNVTILRGDCLGGFTQFPGSPITVGLSPSSVAVGDFNGDGTSDLVTANSGSNNVTILLGNGSGGFTQAGSPIAVGSSPSSVAVGDFDLDGTSDLVTANGGSNTVTILLGNGSGGFTEAPGSPITVGSSPSSVAVGAFNVDRRPYLVTANAGSDNVTILLGDTSLRDCDDQDACTEDTCAPASGCVHAPSADADADGFCDAVDCAPTNPNCNSDCTDADADAFCVTTDCNDANPHCTSDCTDADADGFCDAEDCAPTNPNCNSDCTDADADRYCNPNDNCPSVSNPLQRDSDADHVGDACDCAPQNAGVTTPLGPARNLRFVSPTDLAWDPPTVGDGLTYDLVRSSDASNWQSVTCPATQTTATTASDSAPPAWASAFFYLVRVKSACGENLGTDSTEQRRQAAACTPPSKRVFVTSSTYTGNLGGLAGADEKCQQRAVAAGFPGTFRAWLSDSTTSASARLTHSTVPYKRVDGVQVADDWADLTDGSLDAAIVVDENGVDIQTNDSQVWTATNTNGSPSTYFCSNWTTESAIPWGDVGHAHASDLTWTQVYAMVCSEPNRLYCFEQ